MRLMPRSVFWQLVLATAIVQTLFLGLFIWYTVVSQRRGAEARLLQRTTQQLDQLSAACAHELARGDLVSLPNILELSRISPAIETARLTDLQGNTLAMTSNGHGRGLDAYEKAALRNGLERQIFRIRNGQIEAVTPVMNAGRPLALLWLEPNHGAGLTTIGIVVRVAMAYGGFALLANLLPIFIVVRTLTRPLTKLKDAAAAVVRDPNLTSAFPLPVTTRNEAGQLTAGFNAMVSELEGQRRGLLETLALLNSMLSNAPIGLAFVDRDMRYVRVNEFLAAMHDLPMQRHLGRTPAEFYPGPVGLAKEECVRRVFATGTPVRNVELIGTAGSPSAERAWLMHFYPVRTENEDTRWVGIIATEITERLRAEEALRKTEKLAATGKLAASIAHEINNPLEAVTNLLYLLGTHDQLDATASEMVMTAQSELSRVSEITQQTLRFYRQSTLPGPTNLEEVLDSILVLYHSRIVSANAQPRKRLRGSTEIFGFSGELRQLFANLIGNAIDAMPHGGPLWLRAHRGHGRGIQGEVGEGVYVLIADSGSGMSEATRERIFEAFFTTKEVTGTGLGLWICEEILRKHNATVRVRSRQAAPSGTGFLMFFPDQR
jgi:signal transduction histidine kinase/HAMP domain-containing protein